MLLEYGDEGNVRGRHKRDNREEEPHEASSICSHGGG